MGGRNGRLSRFAAQGLFSGMRWIDHDRLLLLSGGIGNS
jgi:hypothetical protein